MTDNTACPLVVALTGNPNSGKTTIFNSITGAHQHVGNWPGVTVERKEGRCSFRGQRFCVVDLPGTYSLTAYSPEELIARNFILEEKPDVVVHVVDASNLSRNLYLTTQLLELGANVVVALNMIDVVEGRGDRIDIQKLSKLLGCPVVPTVGHRDKGREDLLSAVIAAAETPPEEPLHLHYPPDIEQEVIRLAEALSTEGKLTERYPARWLAVKLLENDEVVINRVKEECPEARSLQLAEQIRHHFEQVYADDPESLITDGRYGFIAAIERDVLYRRPGDRVTVSDEVDKVVANRVLGFPIFLFFMWVMFYLTFHIGGYFAGWIDAGVGWLSQVTSTALPQGPLRSLLVDGVISGVGSVVVFLPNILVMFFMISLLEDSGYMARAAFIMDKLMHRIGLHGKSFIPMIIGFGCNVPAVMATRILDNEKDRLITILINPLMSCSARLPVYILLAGAFFPHRGATVIMSLYLLGVALAALMAWLFRHFLFKGPESAFVMELPPYRLPTLKGTAIHMWERGRLFLQKAGTIILAASVLIWFLSALPWGVEYASEASYAGKLGHVIAPLLAPLGFDWKMTVALLFGFIAKEIVVGTLGVLYGFGHGVEAQNEGLQAALHSALSPLTAYVFMVFTLIYIPCLATIAVIKRETASWKWTAFAVGYTLVLAWVMAFLIYRAGLLLGYR